MYRLFLKIFLLLLLLFQTSTFAQETEPLIVPEVQEETPLLKENTQTLEEADSNDSISPEVLDEEDRFGFEVSEENSPTQELQEEQTKTSTEVSSEPTETVENTQDLPSLEELEAQRAEEAELRELGAGEEPMAK